VDSAAAGVTIGEIAGAVVTLEAAITTSLEVDIGVAIGEEKIRVSGMTGITKTIRDKRKGAVIEEIEVDLEEGAGMTGGNTTEDQEEIGAEGDINMAQEESMLEAGQSSPTRSGTPMTLITIRIIRMTPSKIRRKILSLIT